MTLYKITEEKLNYLGYSKNTCNSYLHFVGLFEKWANKHHSRIGSKDIIKYLSDQNFSSRSQQNQIISALKFMWERALGKKYFKIDFTRPRKQKKFPLIIDQSILIQKINAIENLKHRAIIQLAFSTGMRVGEVINLKIKDIDSVRMIINVRQAKGAKDRIVKLTESTLRLLRKYFKEYRPVEYLFNGQFSPKYSAGSCRNIVKKYIGNEFKFHTLRHAALTSMIENGTDVSVVQKVAGHNSLATTSGYLHLTKNSIQNVHAPI